MRYIVTGGAGFIGSHIAEGLAGTHEVVVLDNLFSGKLENIVHLTDRITFVRGSVTDLPLLKEVFTGADGVFHEAAIASVPLSVHDPLATNEANVTGTLNVAIAARDCGVKKVVFASSSAVYGDDPTLPKREDMVPNPISPYAVSKLTGEYYLGNFSDLYGLKTVSLRYFNVFGPRQDPNSEYAAVIPKFIARIQKKQAPIIYGDGGQTRDFIFVRDVVDANIRAMERSVQGVYNIASGSRTSVNTLAEILISLSGIPGTPVYEKAREGDIYHSYADISRARGAFEYTAATSLENGLKETAEWFKNQQGDFL